MTPTRCETRCGVLTTAPTSGGQAAEFIAIGRALVDKRDHRLNTEGASEAYLKKRTLTNLYTLRPTWLDLAHKKLDEAVLDAYAWPHELTDDQTLERFLVLNLARSGGQEQQ